MKELYFYKNTYLSWEAPKSLFELCTALQLQMYAKYALDWYLCKTVFLVPRLVTRHLQERFHHCSPVAALHQGAPGQMT